MPLTTGTRLGAYEIVALIGAGGMGEVYKARDTRLKRDVAIKVLPEAFSHDPERLARFQREAEVLATLNHPHIPAIYGLEHADGIHAIVMELVEGPTLAQRLSDVASDVGRAGPFGPAEGATPGPKGPGLPLDEVLTIGGCCRPSSRQSAVSSRPSESEELIRVPEPRSGRIVESDDRR